jgi:hypothetical protein
MAGPAMLQGGSGMLQGRSDAAANAATLRAAAVSRQIFRAWLRRGVACAIGEDDLVFSFIYSKIRCGGVGDGVSTPRGWESDVPLWTESDVPRALLLLIQRTRFLWSVQSDGRGGGGSGVPIPRGTLSAVLFLN